MSSLLGGQGRETHKADRQAAAQQYEAMVTQALERLGRWAFPDSQVERSAATEWQLWHTSDDGYKYIDVTVSLEFDGDQPDNFECRHYYNAFTSRTSIYPAPLNREALNDALRSCICSE
jgi:hypothetical protein